MKHRQDYKIILALLKSESNEGVDLCRKFIWFVLGEYGLITDHVSPTHNEIREFLADEADWKTIDLLLAEHDLEGEFKLMFYHTNRSRHDIIGRLTRRYKELVPNGGMEFVKRLIDQWFAEAEAKK